MPIRTITPYPLLKQLIIAGLLISGISCRQHAKSSDPKLINIGDTTRAAIPDTSGAKIKHEAYKEDIKTPPPALTGFVPEHYMILDTAAGDLNLDEYPDMIMVLKKNGEDSTSDVINHPEKRPLFVLIGQPDHSYKLAARNDNVVYCIDCGGMMGDPFMNIVIKNGYFSVEHFGGSGWRWTRIVTFKFSPADNNWYLYRDGHESFRSVGPEHKETKIYTAKDFGKVLFENFDIYREPEKGNSK